MMLFILTGQNKNFWKIYFQNINLVYSMWKLMMKRGLRLRNYYIERYGFLVGSFLVLRHAKLENLRVPFRYYKSLEGFVLRNSLKLTLIVVILRIVYTNFTGIKLWFASNCPDPTEVVYPDYYYPYSIFLVVTLVIGLQLSIVLLSKTLRQLIMKYKYEVLTLNMVNLFVLITVHCTVAHEGLLYVWWLPDSYEMISFNGEEELVMEYWVRELKYWYNQLIWNASLLDLQLQKQWGRIVLYKAI